MTVRECDLPSPFRPAKSVFRRVDRLISTSEKLLPTCLHRHNRPMRHTFTCEGSCSFMQQSSHGCVNSDPE